MTPTCPRYSPVTWLSGETRELYREQMEGVALLAVSPDGTELAVTYGRSLRVMPTEGGPSRVLWTIPEEQDTPFRGGVAWTRDGNHLLIGKRRSRDSNINQVWCISTQDGDPRPIGLEMAGLSHLRISPDGEQITFTGNLTNQGCEVWVLENLPLPSIHVPESE